MKKACLLRHPTVATAQSVSAACNKDRYSNLEQFLLHGCHHLGHDLKRMMKVNMRIAVDTNVEQKTKLTGSLTQVLNARKLSHPLAGLP